MKRIDTQEIPFVNTRFRNKMKRLYGHKEIKRRCRMIIRCLRYRWVLGICMFVLAAAMVSDAAEEKKFTGTIVAAPVDPAGKFAPINLKCQEAEYRIINNKVAQKMQKKWAGKKWM